MSNIPVKAIYEQLQMLSEKDKSVPPPFTNEEVNALPIYNSHKPIPPPFSTKEYNALPEYKSNKGILPPPFSPDEYKHLPTVPKTDPGAGLIEDTPLQRFFGESASADTLDNENIPNDFYNRLMDAESNPKNRAKQSPGSSAFGMYQFTKPTWEYLVGTPEGRAANLKMEGRTWKDPVQQQRAVKIYANKIADVLSNKNLPITNESLYFGWHFGPGSVQDFGDELFLKDPGERLPRGLITNDILEANPGLKKVKNIGDFRNYLTKAMDRYKANPTNPLNKKIVNVMSNTSHQDSPFQNELNPNPEIAVEPMEQVAHSDNLIKYIHDGRKMADDLHLTGDDRIKLIQHYVDAAEEKEKREK